MRPFNDPMIQGRTPPTPDWARSMMNAVTDVRMALTNTPLSTIRSGWTPPRQLRAKTTAPAPRHPSNTTRGMKRPGCGSPPKPTVHRTATRIPPAVTPVMPGSARLFRMTIWRTAPAVPSSAPATMAMSALGSRSSQTTIRCRSSACRPRSDASTSPGPRRTVPVHRCTTNSTPMSASPTAISTENRLAPQARPSAAPARTSASMVTPENPVPEQQKQHRPAQHRRP